MSLPRPARRFAHPVLIPAVVLGAAVTTTSVPLEHLPGHCDAAPPKATIFASTLADSATVYRGTFSPDGQELWYFRKISADPHAEDYRIYVSRQGPDGWSAARRVVLGGESSDLYPSLSSDGRRLVFASYRRAPGDTTAKPSASLWIAERRGDGWGEPAAVASAARPGAYHSHPAFLRDGRLLFRRTSPDWDTTTTLVSAPDGKGFGPPTVYDPVDRWRTWRGDLQVWGGAPTPDGAALLLEVSRRRPDRRPPEPSDLWLSRRDGAGWTEPTPLAAGVNTADGWENFATVTPDGCELVFVRNFSAFYGVSLRAAMGAAQRP